MGAELGHHLGYPAGAERPAGTANQRNGKSAKTVLTEDGPLRVDIPRDREQLRSDPEPRTRWCSSTRCGSRCARTGGAQQGRLPGLGRAALRGGPGPHPRPYPGTVANLLIQLALPKYQMPPSFPRRRESSVFEVPRRGTASHWVPAYAGTTTAGYWQASRHVQACCGLSRRRERGGQTSEQGKASGSSAIAPSERSDAFRAGAHDLRCCRRAAQP
ncbi:hypothetical protein D9M69_539820 [compost metagenome]